MSFQIWLYLLRNTKYIAKKYICFIKTHPDNTRQSGPCNWNTQLFFSFLFSFPHVLRDFLFFSLSSNTSAPSNLFRVRPTLGIIRPQFRAENRNYRLWQSVVIFLWCLLFLCRSGNDRSLIVIRGIRDNKARNYGKGLAFVLVSEGRWAGFPGQNLQR